jgi:polysaccharide export outer membrane protein
MQTSPRLRLLFAFILGLTLSFAASAGADAPVPPKKVDEKTAQPYRITHGDRLAVSVYGEDLNSGGNKVEARGTITLQLIGEIRVSGLTVLEAQAAIENAYRDKKFLRNPQVKITIEEYARRTVNVSGKVNSQGTRELPPDRPMTIKELILSCGGFQETAKGTEVRVTRTLPDGSLHTYRLDVQSALLGKDRASAGDANFVLEPDDTVYVPEKMI